jgi:cell division protein FtsI/penicillin-binding protein 2
MKDFAHRFYMVHTPEMLCLTPRAGLGVLLAGAAITAAIFSPPAIFTADDRIAAESWQSAIDRAAGKAPDARILIVDIASGHLLGSAHLAEAAHTLATPGSTLKPLILYYALASRHWNPQRRVSCTRQLQIVGHRLNCSHPPSDPMDAEQALTWSCNSYFAELAGTLAPGELRRALGETGLFAATGLAKDEDLAEFHEPHTREQNQLRALGVEGIRITLPELAEAYRSLVTKLTQRPETAAANIVNAGLSDSASFGMAGAAALGGVPISGKTGTASAESGGATHGWFAGFAPTRSPRVVIAVYVPAGHGSDAAQVAANLLANSPLRQP